MEHIPLLISDLALILIAASITTVLFKWLKQPVILGYIMAGLVISPQIHLTPDIGDTANIALWSDLGVTFLMFGLGLEFSFKKLLSVGRNAFIAAAVIIPGMIVFGTLVGLALGWTLTNSLLLGGMISMSSTAIIMKAFDDMGLRTQKFTQLVLGVLIFEDLIAILLMVVITTTAVSKSFEGGQLLFELAKLGFFMVLWVLSGIFALPSLMRWMRRKDFLNDETLLVFSLGLCFLMVLAATYVGFSAELGAFVMGSVFAETVEAERIEKVVKPLKDLFGAIFFVSVGRMLDLPVMGEYTLEIAVIACAVICGQIFFATCGFLLSGQTLKTSVQSSFCLTQVGEFAFIIAMLGTNLGLLDAYVYPVIVAVSVLTIFITPFVMKAAMPFYNWLDGKLTPKQKLFLERTSLNAGVSVHNENMWQNLLMAILRIVGVYSVIIVFILLIYCKYLLPVAVEMGFWPKTLLAALTILLLAPFLRAIIAKKNHSREYKFLLSSNKTNIAPLMLLTGGRFLLAIFFVAFLLYRTYSGATGILFSLATLLVLGMFYSRILKMHSIRLERRFFANLNQREMEAERLEQEGQVFRNARLSSRLQAYDLHLSGFEVSANSCLCGKTLIESDFRRRYGVHVVSIIRGANRINIPGGRECLFPCDKVLVLGTDMQLAEIEPLFAAVPQLEHTNLLEKEVSLEQLEISKDNPLVGMTIRECGIRDHNKCLVVGIERDNESMMNPDVQTQFQAGDVVWIVGESDCIHNLMQTDTVSIVESN